MTIRAGWDTGEQAIIYVMLRGDWTWDDLNRQIELALDLVQQHRRPVPAIIDVEGGLKIPGGSIFQPKNLEQSKNLMLLNQQRTMPLVIVGADADARMTYDTLRMMDSRIGWQVYFTNTAEEARDFLQQYHTPTREVV